MKGSVKIGYALGGGATRGLSHIGVLKVLHEIDSHAKLYFQGKAEDTCIISGSVFALGHRLKRQIPRYLRADTPSAGCGGGKPSRYGILLGGRGVHPEKEPYHGSY